MAIQNGLNLTTTGIVIADGAGTYTGAALGTNGQLLIGNTGSDPAFGSITGGNHLQVTEGAGTLDIDLTSNVDTTAIHGWNGSILEDPAIAVTSDGATITISLQKSGGGDLTLVFSDEFATLDCTPALTATLTAGTDTVPVLNYIYVLQSAKTVMTVSTASFPASEHIRIATVLCQSAASLQTDGAYKVHQWSDHLVNSVEQGHISHLNSWIRNQDATWVSGVAQTFTITPNGGAADNVIITTTSGTVLQLHDHTFPAFAGTPDLYVINDNATPYTKVTDMNALLTDSTGASMSGKYFSLVLWGVVSEDTADCKLMVNLPGGSYNSAAAVTTDASKFANFTIPAAFRGTGFLIAQWNLRNQTSASGTWTSIDEIDLRGFMPNTSAGGTTAIPSEFIDSTFRILDDGDNSREIAFQASGITTATTRTITMADQDISLVPNTGTYAAAAGGTQITTLGTIATGTWQGTTIAVDQGGTGQTSYTNGQLLIGNTTGNTLDKATLTGTANQITVTNGSGSITLSTPQSIDTGASVQFADLTLNNTGLHILDTNASHDLIIAPGSDLTADRTLNLTTGDADRTLTLSGNLTVESASLINQDLTSDAGPTFASLSLSTGNLDLAASTSLTFNSTAILADAAGTMTLSNIDALDATTEATIEAAIDTLANLTSASSLATVGTITSGTWQGTTIAVDQGGTGQTSYTNGQLLIGNTTGNTLTKATLTGTANQITVTNGTGSITLSTPQDIATSSEVTFGKVSATNSQDAATVSNVVNTNAGTSAIARMSVNTDGSREGGFQMGSAANTDADIAGILHIFGNANVDDIIIENGKTTGTFIIKHRDTTHLTIDSTGAMTLPLQPAFLATSAAQNNVTGDGTGYTVQYTTEIQDNNADFDGTSTFTSPSTGMYLLGYTTRFDGVEAASQLDHFIITSNRNYGTYEADIGTVRDNTNDFYDKGCVLADMDSADTATINAQVGLGTKVVDITTGSYFYGQLLN